MKRLVVIPGYTFCVKTAISVPDELFERVERFVAEAGISRSQLYATAAARYLEELEHGSVTAQLDAALARAGDAGASEVGAIGRERLAALTEHDEW